MPEFLTEEELSECERIYKDGIETLDVVKIFREAGIRFSEPSFRKYVQLGLLSRSHRVSAGGRGKHRGSKGVYPFGVVRRINDIKRMMSEGLTIDDIVRASMKFASEINQLDNGLQRLFSEMQTEVCGPHFDTSLRPQVESELQEAQTTARTLITKLVSIDQNITNPRPTL
ncbi:MAG: MerR family transcriptional regulator [Deltaproteobacteria bacterium HGW-Deltaproteobacteria-17]|nr:MAG: MerR family transcriptional regulator [Deltaproteobacteria bacterium HGW-Deltaproteobacteria-17]